MPATTRSRRGRGARSTNPLATHTRARQLPSPLPRQSRPRRGRVVTSQTPGAGVSNRVARLRARARPRPRRSQRSHTPSEHPHQDLLIMIREELRSLNEASQQPPEDSQRSVSPSTTAQATTITTTPTTTDPVVSHQLEVHQPTRIPSSGNANTLVIDTGT